MTSPIGIDLLAGAVGMSRGFGQAGFDMVATVAIDPVLAAIHTFSFPDCKIIARSLPALTGGKSRSLAGNRGLDVVFGGAPVPKLPDGRAARPRSRNGR